MSLLAAGVAWSDSLTLVTSRAAQNASDAVQWAQLGGDGTVIGANVNVVSVNGVSIGLALAGPNSVVSVVCSSPATSPCSWTGPSATAGHSLLWTSDAGNGGNGPVTLNFNNPVIGAGVSIQADAPGQFTAQIQAFNQGNLLGSFTETSTAKGLPVYIGVIDQSGANITSVTFNLTTCTDPGGDCVDFALDSVSLNTPVPVASLSSTNVTFAGQQVGTSSASQSVKLTNTGTGPLSITSISPSGDYSETNNCGSSVGIGANCSIGITFKPTATGTRTGSVTITDNASGSPQSISLTGTGIAPVVNLNPTGLTFPSQMVNTTSAAQSVTLKNTGTALLTISNIAATGDFAQTNTCSGSVAVNATCAINVTFTPTATGTRTGSVKITDNASGSPQSISLSGLGSSGTPVVSLSPTSFDLCDEAARQPQ